MKPRVVGLGLCVLDRVYRVASLSLADSRLRYSERLELVGGMTANALGQAAALGCHSEVLSTVGDDPEGRAIRRGLRAAGVATRRLRTVSGPPSTVSVCLVEQRTGERRFVVAERRALEAAAPDFDLSPLRRAAVLLVDGHFAGQALRAVKEARRLGVPVVGDFTRPSAAVERLLRHVDHPVVSEEFAEAAGATPRAALTALRQTYGGWPVVTLGGRGGLFWDGRRVARYRARRARIVDTTGAGDAFHGAFAAGLAHGLGLRASIALAARAGARACTVLGGSAGWLRREEVAALRAIGN